MFINKQRCLKLKNYHLIQSICSEDLGIICKNNEACIPTFKRNKHTYLLGIILFNYMYIAQ